MSGDVDPVFLDELRRFEALLASAGDLVGQSLRPGLEPALVRERLAEIGLVPSRQLLTWFFWHDGIDLLTGRSLLHWRPLTLDEAVTSWHVNTNELFPLGLVADQPEWGAWRPSWLPIGSSGGMPQLAADCSPGADTDACRVASVSPDGGLFDQPEHPQNIRALDQAVQIWTHYIVSGWCQYLPSERRWHSESYPPAELLHLTQTGI